MKNKTKLLGSSLLIWTALSYSFSFSFAGTPGKDYVSGEVLIKYKDAVSSQGMKRTLDAMSGIPLQEVGGDRNLLRVKLIRNESVEASLSRLQNDPNVLYAQPNFVYHATSTTPNDPSFSQQWGLSNTGQTVMIGSGGTDGPDSVDNPGTPGDDMGLSGAWDYVTDCSSVIVAVLDTGVDYNQEDLSSNMWEGTTSGFPLHGINFADSNSDPMDNNGHGTHVAGVIGAEGNNGLGTTGVCWKVQLMAVKVLDATGSGTTASISNGINWAYVHGAKVLNLSLGSSTDDPAMANAVVNAGTAGAVVVTAAGNSAADNDGVPFYPCDIPSGNLLCVAAVDQSFNLASFSNYGSRTVQVGAPGVNILSTWPYSSTVVTDNFAGWTTTSSTAGQGWGNTTTSIFGINNEPLLGNPFNWGSGGAQYKTNTNDHAYKVFDLSGGYNKISLQFYEGYNLTGTDSVKTYVSASGGDPVSTGVLQESDSGSTGNTAFLKTYNLESYCPAQAPSVCSCGTSTCSIGYQLQSGGASAGGPFVIRFELIKSLYGPSNYDVLEGTSMAAPHVAGLAALLFAYQPTYTWFDVVQSIEQGGTPAPALSGKTVTGNVVNALGSLGFINAPQGVLVQKL